MTITIAPGPDGKPAMRRSGSGVDSMLKPSVWHDWLPASGNCGIDKSAAQFGITRAELEPSVKAIVAQVEKDRRERKADDERHRREQRKTRDREFKLVAELPECERVARLDGLARALGEDPATVREGFAAVTSPPALESLEPWPDPVETAVVLEELIKQLRRFIVFRHELDAVAVALWIMFAWIHDVAVHSQGSTARRRSERS